MPGRAQRREPITATTVAVLSDVHGNATALEAVLAEVDREQPDVVVFGGDLTWGPEPERTLALVEAIEPRTVFVRGNADRVLLACAARLEEGDVEGLTPREAWLPTLHSPAARAFIASFAGQVVVDVDGLGPVRFCHGSPRSDEELVTPATPEARIDALMEGIPERVLVTAHTHLQFDRAVAGIRSVNAGSVGMPYAERPGAYWATLGPDVELRCTDHDLEEAARSYRSTADPLREQMVALLLAPPPPDEVIAHAESVEFTG